METEEEEHQKDKKVLWKSVQSDCFLQIFLKIVKYLCSIITCLTVFAILFNSIFMFQAFGNVLADMCVAQNQSSTAELENE